MSLRLLTGDVLRCLAKLPDESVQCVVTSPPYWGLRDYGTATWKGGKAECDHAPRAQVAGCLSSKGGPLRDKPSLVCKCGARRIDDQIGLEPTPELFVAKMVAVFREIRRVLRPDGCAWVNLGDSYSQVASARGQSYQRRSPVKSSLWADTKLAKRDLGNSGVEPKLNGSLKQKDLVGIPWRVAFALQADGWYLRSDIIWSKPNPMPESVRDRPTKSHEYVFLLTKRSRYFYDSDAIKEPSDADTIARYHRGRSANHKYADGGPGNQTIARTMEHMSKNALNGKRTYVGINDRGADTVLYATRNSRSVWTITPKPFKGAHFATFPPALVERCVKAGTSEAGCCPQCSAPWERVTEITPEYAAFKVSQGWQDGSDEPRLGFQVKRQKANTHPATCPTKNTTIGWHPTCSCPAAEPVPCVVLDPFSGAGTVGLVCKQLGRSFVGIDLNPSYVRMARRRIAACPRPA